MGSVSGKPRFKPKKPRFKIRWRLSTRHLYSASRHCSLLLDPNHHCLEVWENWASEKHGCHPVHESAFSLLRRWWPAVINKCQPNTQAGRGWLNLMARRCLASSQLFILFSSRGMRADDASAFGLNYKGLPRECHFFTSQSKHVCTCLFAARTQVKATVYFDRTQARSCVKVKLWA